MPASAAQRRRALPRTACLLALCVLAESTRVVVLNEGFENVRRLPGGGLVPAGWTHKGGMRVVRWGARGYLKPAEGRRIGGGKYFLSDDFTRPRGSVHRIIDLRRWSAQIQQGRVSVQLGAYMGGDITGVTVEALSATKKVLGVMSLSTWARVDFDCARTYWKQNPINSPYATPAGVPRSTRFFRVTVFTYDNGLAVCKSTVDNLLVTIQW